MFFTTIRSEMNDREHQMEKGKLYEIPSLNIDKNAFKLRSSGDHKNSNQNDVMKAYNELRSNFDDKFPPSDVNRMLNRVKSLRDEQYEPIHTFEDSTSEIQYDVFDCPEFPPENYPQAWHILDIVDNWNPDDPSPPIKPKIYQGICVFNHKTDFEKALNYRNAEKPFVIRDDPIVLETAERWSYPEYLKSLLGDEIKHRTEYSQNNHFMFWRLQKKKNPYQGIWEPPTENIRMSYVEWLEKAKEIELDYDENKPHWYFRLNSCSGEHCSKEHTDYLYNEVPFLEEKKSLYIVDPSETRGINCRFGMKGNIAENHYDSSRNMIAIFYGERRYILSHPDQCKNTCLYKNPHPSARHSAVDYSKPDLGQFPDFANAKGNEIVLQAGDVLYLPTFWFHYIISLGINYQCNGRSGDTTENLHHIHGCGFR